MKHLTTSNVALDQLLGGIYPGNYTIYSTNRGNTATTFVPYFVDQVERFTPKANKPEGIYIVYDEYTEDDLKDIFKGMVLSRYLDNEKYPNIHLIPMKEGLKINGKVKNSLIFYIFTSKLATIMKYADIVTTPIREHRLVGTGYTLKDFLDTTAFKNNNYIFMIDGVELKYIDRCNQLLYQYKTTCANLETNKHTKESKPSLRAAKAVLEKEIEDFENLDFEKSYQKAPWYISNYIMATRDIDYDNGIKDQEIDTMGVVLTLMKTEDRKFLHNSTMIRFTMNYANVYQSPSNKKHSYTEDDIKEAE